MKLISPALRFILPFFFIWGCSSLSFAQSEKQMIRAVRETKETDLKIIRLIELGEYYSDKNLKKTQDIQSKVNFFAKQGSTKTTIDVALFNALVYRLERDFSSLYRSIQPFEGVNLSNESLHKQQKILQNLGYYYTVKIQHHQADSWLKKALILGIKLNDNAEICRTCCYISYNETLNKNKEAALLYAEKAFDAAKKTQNKSDLAMSYYFQSAVYDFFGQPDLALSKELLSLSYAKGAQNYSLLPLIAKRVGEKQIVIQNLKEALYYFENSYNYAKVYSDFRLKGLALVSQSNVKRLQKKFSESFELSARAIVELKIAKSNGGLGIAELNLAKTYVDKEEYDAAIQHLDVALNYLNQSLNEEIKAEVYELKGIIAKKRKSYTEALHHLNLSIEAQNKLGNTEKAHEIYPVIAEIYEAQGNQSKALQYLERYVMFSQKNNKNVAARRIAELNEIYRSEQRDELIAKQTSILEKQKREKELTKTKLENISLRNNLQTYIILGFVIIVFLGVVIVISRNRRISLQQKRREAEMSQILLRTQMNPHFIFNAMSVIQSYIFENDVKNSSKFLVNFSRLIRLILENSPKEFISLETEIEILQKYLETQKLRFEDRFDFEIICPEKLIYDNVKIPPMITQPFVENSIEHGQLHTLENGHISIRFSKENDMLKIEIEDNGIGREESERLKKSKEHTSMALQITQDRIKILNEKHNTNGYLKISDLEGNSQSGTRVIISLPCINELI
ncbi:MAG: histidine kinase [Crocinitomicaceae bacterium]